MTDQDEKTLGWWAYTKVIAILLVGVAAMVFLPRITADASGSDLVWMAVFMLGIGGPALWLGVREFRERQLMLNTPTSKVRSLAVGDVEIKGQARPADEPLTSPVTNSKVCAFKLEIEEEHQDDEGTEWNTVLEFQDQVEFVVDDGTGEVLVEPSKADLDVELEETVHVNSHEAPPANVQEWAQTDAGQDIVDMQIPRDEGGKDGVGGKVTDAFESHLQSRAQRHLLEESGDDRRYKERILEVGESTYVFGGAYPKENEAHATNVDNLVIRKHEGTGKFIVSDKSEAQRAEEGLVSTALLSAIGLALIPTGFIALLRWLGVL